ncbi:MAG: DUF4340 domain-containing protein [Rhodanobacteraceae bacterium]
MTRSMLTNLILLALAVLLGIAVLAQVRREQDLRAQPLTTLDTDAINALAVRCTDCPARRFAKISGHWWMQTPYRLPADDKAVMRLLAIADAPVRSLRPASAFDLSRIGLGPAQATIDFGTRHLAIGTTDAIDGDRYVHIDNNVALVEDRFSPYLHADAASELDRHLLPRGARLLELRVDDVPQPQRMDAWRTIEAQRIVKADPKAHFAGVAIHAQLSLDDGSMIDYRFYHGAADTVALRKAPPLVYTLREAQALALLGPSNSHPTDPLK